MCRGHKKTRKLKTRHLCDLLHNFTIISLIRKPKKYLKRIANFYKVANYQPVITPTSIWLLKVNFKRTRTRCEICSELKIEIVNLCHSGVFIVNFQHISYFLPVFFLLNLNVLIPTRNIFKLLNVRLILRHCLCFLMGLMAQNLKTNRILHSGKVSLCNLNHCKSLLMKKISWCHIVLHIVIPTPCILKGPINFSMKSRAFAWKVGHCFHFVIYS